MVTGEPPKAPVRFFIALTSPPAENALPAPVRITQRMSLSELISSQTRATSSPSPGAPSAFMLSGRSRVRIATWPRFSTFSRDMALRRLAEREILVTAQVMVGGAEQRGQHGGALEVVADGQLVGHAHAAVQLDGLFADVFQ